MERHAIVILFLTFYQNASPAFIAPRRPEVMQGVGRNKGGDRSDWFLSGQEELKEALQTAANMNVAKNVILFIGDGMGVSTVSAARIYKAQKRQLSGLDALLSWELFPHAALSRTYNVDRQVADSGSSGTAYNCGYKARDGTIGLNANGIRGLCNTTKGNEVTSVLKYSKDAGKWTGIVTTTRVTHATPASAYANSADRGWESDFDMYPMDRQKCSDIAKQLIDDNDLRVILGGGRFKFVPEGTPDPEYPHDLFSTGVRVDGRNLIHDWLKNKTLMTKPDRVKYVWNITEFEKVEPRLTDYLMGLFQPDHMQYELDRENKSREFSGEPSLAQMVEKAIGVLKQSTNGFFLLVEGGRIDMAHHNSNAARAMADTLALSDAVEKAVQMTSEDDTLIVVSADHSHVFTMAGYPQIDNPILGVVNGMVDLNNRTFTTLGYQNGPGYKFHLDMSNRASRRMRNLTNILTENVDYKQYSGTPLISETHGGEDVSIYARGPMSHLFHGSHEQNYIAHVMMYASCVGPNKRHCAQPPITPVYRCSSFAGPATSSGCINPRNYIFILLSILIYMHVRSYSA